MDARHIIQRAIRNTPGERITFHDYMAYALYAKDSGYYERPRQKIGKAGDFYTNASVGAVYGDVLGDVLWEMLQALSVQHPVLVEMGGGTGQLGAQVLHRLQQLGWMDEQSPRRTYMMIETSAYHQRIQQETLAPFQDVIDIRWYGSIQEAKQAWPNLSGVLFSNELPDAFPVHLIEYRDGKWWEVYVVEGDDGFAEQAGELSQSALHSYIQKESIPPLEGYRTEVNLNSLAWLEEIAQWMKEGYVLTVDYGYDRSVLYAPSRKSGTLLCYRNHMISENPYEAPGEVDMTSHVNFSALIDAGERHEMKTLGFYTQQEFLMQAGILTYLAAHEGGDPFRNEAARRNRAVRQLIMPEGMGRAFRVLIQGKGVEAALSCCRPWTPLQP